jgi:hypothetical protein
MTSHSSNTVHNGTEEIPPVLPSAQANSNLAMVSTPASSIHNGLSSNDTFDDFEQVRNKKKQKRKRKQAAPTPVLASVAPPLATSVVPGTDVPLLQVSSQLDLVSQPSHLPKQIPVSNESTRYAQTRYPFPPFSIRFNSGKISPNHVKEALIEHCKKIYQMDIIILNCRLSYGGSPNQYDILLFLKDAPSFSFLLDQNQWPNMFNNETFIFPSWPAIPPQLSLLIKNVDLRIDFDDFCSDVKLHYPQVKNVIRMKNKFQNDIKLIKLELTSSIVREKLLADGKITVGYIVYDIDEYLAPVYVLICSKCMGIGHFKKQCSQTKVICRTCGDQVDDIKLHKCSNIEKCIHCGQSHKSNSLKCQVVKSFRAELTRKLLSSNNHGASSAANNVNNINSSSILFNGLNFPSMPVPHLLPNNQMVNKLDELLEKMSEVNAHLANLKVKYDKFEQFAMEKNESDLHVKESINLVSKQSIDLKKDVAQLNLFFQQHDNAIMKLLVPMFMDLFGLIAKQNHDRKGNPLDADLKLKLERYLTQMKNLLQSKHFIN